MSEGGVQPATVALPQGLGAAITLRVGQQFPGIVTSRAGGLAVQFAGVRVPLSADVVLELGQAVTIEVVNAERGVQLRVTPRPPFPGAGARPGGQSQPSPAPPTSTQAPPTQGSPATPRPFVPGQAAPAPQQAQGAQASRSTPAQTPPQGAAAEGAAALKAAAARAATQQAAETSPAPGSTPPSATQAGGALSPAAEHAAQAQATSGAPAQSATEATTAQLHTVVTAALESLGAAAPAETAAQLLPANLPVSAAAFRLVLALHTMRGSTGADLQLIQTAIAEAATQGAAPQALANEVMGLLVPLLVTEGMPPERLLQQSARTRAPIEARLAQALASGNVDEVIEQLVRDVRSVLARIQRDETLLRFLQQSGGLRRFQEAVAHVLERLSAADLQNIRSLEQPYHFFELPVTPDSGFHHVQVHFIGEKHGKGRGFDAQNASVVLDLSTTVLGDLWIGIGIVGGRCTCTFRATQQATVDAIEESEVDLRDALGGAGYPEAQIRAMLWDGNRFREAVNLAQRFAGISLEG